MSRNVRQKYPNPPVKATKRRGSDTSSTTTLNLSESDQGYSGVEEVSDSDEDDEEHVFAAEEEHIITDASRKRSPVPPRPFEPEPEDEADDEEAEEADEDAEDDNDDVADESGSWDGILSELDSTATEESPDHDFGPELMDVRRVRFTGVPDSDSDSTTSDFSSDEQGFFPDLFVDQRSLDPAFRREIENDEDSSNSGSFWDFHELAQAPQDFLVFEDGVWADSEEGDNTPVATPLASDAVAEVSTPTISVEVQELDGYETDGDTTEEDVPEQPIRKKQPRRHPPIELSSDSDTEKPTPSRRGKPRVGRFNLDNSRKPIAVLNTTTRKMMIFTPQRISQLDLAPETFNIGMATADLSGSPILSNPGFVMMGAMIASNTFGDFMNTQPIGPTEAFFPLTSDPPMDSDDSEFAMKGPDEGETNLRIEDFITFHVPSDEEEFGTEWNGDETSSPTRPQTAASGASAATDFSASGIHPLLSHFDNNSDAVGAFRRNQISQQLISSDKASQESLAFSGPYTYGTLRGVKSGSLGSVTTPITPARRHKRSNTVATNGFEFQASPSQKRKASSSFTDSLHKKQRSISDMGHLQI